MGDTSTRTLFRGERDDRVSEAISERGGWLPLVDTIEKFLKRAEQNRNNPFVVYEKGKNITFEEKRGNSIVGYGTLTVRGKPTARYTAELALYVDKDCRKRGIGSALVKLMIDEAKKKGLRKIWLRVYTDNLPAIALYKKFGFQTEGKFMEQEWLDGKPLDLYSMALFIW